ncbi:MAG: phenylalanine--tRNA ligase subunit beta [Gammaproteobacteria bacterium]|nr:phenylalanine--tRNA ligase subunit beta [Gammaproteobacteria bacterium]
MKLSESWLRQWVNPNLTQTELCDTLAMAGLEVDGLTPAAELFSGVVIGQVKTINKHPDAERLQICEVDVGASAPVTIVCGAKNVKTGMKVPVALPKSRLPNNITIEASKVRGVQSNGMLCSSAELGLPSDAEGLYEFLADAPIGNDVWDYLQLDDTVFDIAITPNRGDCLSVLGMASEIAALTDNVLTIPTFSSVSAVDNEILPIVVDAEEECPSYVGRIIRAVNVKAATPVWLSECLRRSGIRSINPVVDVMNYVMLELGQPMHAFNLSSITGGVEVRFAKQNEMITLLNDREVQLDPKILVIADQAKPLAIAGVMGGLDSSVNQDTTDVFLESAYFKPTTVAYSCRHYNLASDSAYRFERGVDPMLGRIAIDRASQLLMDIVGGKPGSVIEKISSRFLPQPLVIELRAARLQKILGCTILDADVENSLQSLGLKCESKAGGWLVTVPARRSDITLEIDLIEEVVRLYGYNNLPITHQTGMLQINPDLECKTPLNRIRIAMCDQGYQEVVSYSFVEKKLQTLLNPEQPTKELVNPITADMSVMRTNLWPGLINVLLYNQNRQQNRVQIFETGLRFVSQDNALLQEAVLSGLVCGSVYKEQWGMPSRPFDFFDVKGDLQNLLSLTGNEGNFLFKPAKHAALHPGQTANIYLGDHCIGIVGALHPSIIQSLKIDNKVFVFEISLDVFEAGLIPKCNSLSKFPEIRRDIAILINESVPFHLIQDTIRNTAGEWLNQVDIFDVYQGKGVPAGQKSIALALTLQHSSRTLVDEEVVSLMDRVIVALKETFNAELRG